MHHDSRWKARRTWMKNFRLFRWSLRCADLHAGHVAARSLQSVWIAVQQIRYSTLTTSHWKSSRFRTRRGIAILRVDATALGSSGNRLGKDLMPVHGRKSQWRLPWRFSTAATIQFSFQFPSDYWWVRTAWEAIHWARHKSRSSRFVDDTIRFHRRHRLCYTTDACRTTHHSKNDDKTLAWWINENVAPLPYSRSCHCSSCASGSPLALSAIALRQTPHVVFTVHNTLGGLASLL